MIKFFIFLFLFTIISLKSFADQGYYLVEINCYPKSGYFEIRYYETHNLNMHTQGIMDENNLYDLSAYLQNEKNISGTCKMKSNEYVETKHSISYQLKPFGNIKYKISKINNNYINKCLQRPGTMPDVPKIVH